MGVTSVVKEILLAGLRRGRTQCKILGKRRFLSSDGDLHIGAGTCIWAPDAFRIGRGVYIGKNCSLEANAEIGDYCLLANNVAFVGRRDHDVRAVGYPIRFAPWIGDCRSCGTTRREQVTLGADVWLGYGVIVLTGVTVGRGAVVGAGSIVTRDVPPYAIAAGAPAKVIGQRFSAEEIARHEAAIAGGIFFSSERGRSYFRINPGKG